MRIDRGIYRLLINDIHMSTMKVELKHLRGYEPTSYQLD